MDNPERANSIITQLKDTITNKAHAFSVTFTDLFATHYGINLNAPITYNEQLSNAVTNLFTNTEESILISISKSSNSIYSRY